MARIPLAIPEVDTREVTIEIPDSLVAFLTPEGRRRATSASSAAARSASQVVASARKQAGPLLQGASISASTAASTAAKRGAELATSARETGAVLAERAREQWIPTVRTRIDEATPVVAEGLETSAARAAALATAVGASAQMGVQVAADATGRAVRGSLSATGSAISQVFSFVFWLGVVIWLLLRVFYPEKEQRARVYARVKRLTGLEI
ncbi:MAG: hypothetical protein M3P51_01075 [Chloroflexota bacterium]|nr:hypothetical protein [Chloroflexota bacterium]